MHLTRHLSAVQYNFCSLKKDFAVEKLSKLFELSISDSTLCEKVIMGVVKKSKKPPQFWCLFLYVISLLLLVLDDPSVKK